MTEETLDKARRISSQIETIGISIERIKSVDLFNENFPRLYVFVADHAGSGINHENIELNHTLRYQICNAIEKELTKDLKKLKQEFKEL